MHNIRIDQRKDVAIVTIDRGKVNALNHDLVKEIRTSFSELEKNEDIRGVIITGKPHYFSAGLDLIELYDYDLGQIKAFWEDFFGMMVDLIKFSKPTIAAITGHSPAGGAVIALTCDHRFMAEGDHYLIGLNEVAVGILINETITELYSFWLGRRVAYQALLEGKLFSPAEAKSIGLVDRVVPGEDLLQLAIAKLRSLLSAGDYILTGTKRILRSDLMERIDIDFSEDLEARAKYWMSPRSRATIGKMVEKLTSRK